MDKNTRATRSCFHHYFLVFEYPGEALALVVHTLHKKITKIAKLYFQRKPWSWISFLFTRAKFTPVFYKAFSN